MFFNDPENLQEFLKPVGGDVHIRPGTGSLFNAELCIKKLKYVGLFSISANSFTVSKDEQEDFIGLTIPLSAPFTVNIDNKQQIFDSTSAYMFLPNCTLDVSAINQAHFLVSNFFIDPINDYSNKLLQSNYQGLLSMSPNVSLLSPGGSLLLRGIAQVWSALNNASTSEILLKELEDNLLASLVLYSNTETNIIKDDSYKGEKYRLNRAIEYINENLRKPITRDNLAAISCRSIRTLSRSFIKKYGVGPMTYTRQRRLDATYIKLLSLNSNSTTVAKTALEYGFSHLGKFAIVYKKTFGESPSTTLSK
ncbi:MAG: helix-turn-helix domain-containing protein [Gammaproteobacteria bacterium]|nr:helix-turn-helix domain-containing protein [Gammaproteobacteria bacterium]